MLRRLVVTLLAGVLAIFSIGCAKEAKDTGPPFPKIPKGFESKPGFGAMNEKKPAAEPGKEEAAPTEGAAPAGDTTPATEPAQTDAPPAEGAAPAGDTPAAEPAKADAPPAEGAAPADGGTENTN